MNLAAPGAATRLYFIDWLRIIAFFVLILYHVGMYYVTWGWHVKSPNAGDAIEPLMMLSSPWRMGLLFLISGVASRFMLDKMRASRFMRERSVRLLVPLLFGMLVIVPAQPYFEVIEKLGYQGSYLDFMRLYLAGYGGFCEKDCLTLPTWNHLWFLPYLWVYTLALGALVLALGPRQDALARRVAGMLSGWKIVALPLAVLTAARFALMPYFPSTHALVGDWYLHAVYFPLFLLGALVAREGRFWARLESMRWTSLALALAGWASLMVYFSLPGEIGKPALPLMRTVYALCQWVPLMAACGFARRHLDFDSAARRYLTQAVFPVYILHQTLIVSIAHAIKPARLAPGIEALILVVLTLTISFGVFEVVRRVRPLRPLFGLGKTDAAVRDGLRVLQGRAADAGTA